MQTELFPTAPAITPPAPVATPAPPPPDFTCPPDLPLIALSIRQPWAWLIMQRLKPVENRCWYTRYRGPFLIHAAKGMTRAEYQEAVEFAQDIVPSIHIPGLKELDRGGIVGMATVTDCVASHGSPWFVGPFGFVLADVQPLPFKPMTGALGFFKANYTTGHAGASVRHHFTRPKQ